LANYGNVYRRTYIKNKSETTSISVSSPIVLTLPLPESNICIDNSTKSKRLGGRTKKRKISKQLSLLKSMSQIAIPANNVLDTDSRSLLASFIDSKKIVLAAQCEQIQEKWEKHKQTQRQKNYDKRQRKKFKSNNDKGLESNTI
jgi:hypothetical protein